MIKVKLDNGVAGSSGMIGARYAPEAALAEAVQRHLPSEAYELNHAHLPGSAPSEFRGGGRGVSLVTSARLVMSADELRSALAQIEDHAAGIAEENEAEVEWHDNHVANRTAELTEAMATARAALEPLCSVHKAFGAACELVADVNHELAQLKKSKPQRIGLAGSLRTLRDALQAELARIEAEQNEQDDKILAVLRRRGIAA